MEDGYYHILLKGERVGGGVVKSLITTFLYHPRLNMRPCSEAESKKFHQQYYVPQEDQTGVLEYDWIYLKDLLKKNKRHGITYEIIYNWRDLMYTIIGKRIILNEKYTKQDEWDESLGIASFVNYPTPDTYPSPDKLYFGQDKELMGFLNGLEQYMSYPKGDVKFIYEAIY